MGTTQETPAERTAEMRNRNKIPATPVTRFVYCLAISTVFSIVFSSTMTLLVNSIV